MLRIPQTWGSSVASKIDWDIMWRSVHVHHRRRSRLAQALGLSYRGKKEQSSGAADVGGENLESKVVEAKPALEMLRSRLRIQHSSR